jgi:hypothetical protein
MAVPYIFQNVTGSIPLANLDTNFNTPIVLGSTTIRLGDTASSLSGLTSVSTTNLAASGTVSGTGFSAYLASPPAVGGTVPNTGAFTTLTSNSTTTLNGTTIPASKTLVVTTDIGTSVQAYSANLAGWSALATTAKQDTLVSGTNIKTVNSTSLLGSGDVSVGTVTSITAGTGLSGGTITGSGTIAIDSTVATLSGSQTLTNKTLTSPVITTGTTSGKFTFGGAIDETVYAVVDAAGVALSPSNGTIQTWTLGASRTPTAGTWDAGESMTLMINDGTAYTITWTTLAVTWVGGTAPTLATSGFTVIELWKVGSTIYGAYVGAVA